MKMQGPVLKCKNYNVVTAEHSNKREDLLSMGPGVATQVAEPMKLVLCLNLLKQKGKEAIILFTETEFQAQANICPNVNLGPLPSLNGMGDFEDAYNKSHTHGK